MEYETLNELKNSISMKIKKGIQLVDLKEDLKNYVGTDWEQYKSFNSEKYTRNIIYNDDDFEIILICWDKFQSSKIHDHPEKGCLLKIMEGQLLEENFNKVNDEFIFLNRKNLVKNEISYKIGHNGLHNIINEHENQSISLHIYSPPNYKANFY